MPISGKLFTLSAPSGAGKTSLVSALLERSANLRVSVSHTTREKRPGEEDGVNYFFSSTEQFEAKISEGAFLEHAKVFNNYYGTSKAAVEQLLAKGTDVILEIDWQGAAQIRQLLPAAVSIFILPPSKATLEQRLTGRGQDSRDVIQHRLEEAQGEMRHYAEADYLVVNDDFETALQELETIFKSHKLTTSYQQQYFNSLIKELLS